MRPLLLAHRIAACSLLLVAHALAGSARFEITVSASAHAGPLTGRLVLIVSKSAQPEPRLTVGPQGPAIFGVDLDGLEADRAMVVDDSSLGYPSRLAELPPGDYFVQAVINVYEEVHRSDGHTLWLHMNNGRLETFAMAAGNLYSDVVPVHLGDREGNASASISVTHVIPPAPRPADTEWVKHVTVESETLTRFWGRPISIHATVLLPQGYADHSDVSYPCVYTLGHDVPFSFTTDASRARGRGVVH